MDLRVDSKSHVPVRVQLEEQIKHLILYGKLEVGSRLPSIRELAGYLRVNRNTVARVVTELERGGYVESRRGSGVFVIEPPVEARDLGRERFLERVVEQARAEGIPVEELGYELLTRAGSLPVEKVPLLFVECNRWEVERFSVELEERLPVRVEGVLLEELADRVAIEEEPSWRMVVTTFYHVVEVEQTLAALERSGLETFALLTEATIDGLRKLAEMPEGTTVGVVGNSKTCVENLMKSMEGSGLEHLNFFKIQAEAGEIAARAELTRASVVVCASSVLGWVEELNLPEEIELIVQDLTLSKGGMEMLGRMLHR